MQTTEIKYAIMDRVTGKLLDYYKYFSGTHLTSGGEGSATWLLSTLNVASKVFESKEDGTYTDPVLMINISPASHCVVKVTIVCHVEIVE